jgi:hypothetical protein
VERTTRCTPKSDNESSLTTENPAPGLSWLPVLRKKKPTHHDDAFNVEPRRISKSKNDDVCSEEYPLVFSHLFRISDCEQHLVHRLSVAEYHNDSYGSYCSQHEIIAIRDGRSIKVDHQNPVELCLPLPPSSRC